MIPCEVSALPILKCSPYLVEPCEIRIVLLLVIPSSDRTCDSWISSDEQALPVESDILLVFNNMKLSASSCFNEMLNMCGATLFSSKWACPMSFCAM